MYPTLSDFLKDVFNINVRLPIQSYGLMMALAFIGAWLVAYYEMKRKEREGKFIEVYIKQVVGKPASVWELLVNLLLIWFLMYKIFGIFVEYDKFVANPEDYILSWQGAYGVLSFIISALYTAYYWWKKDKSKLPKPKIEYKKVMPHELLGNIIIVAGVAGLIGAKVFDSLSNYKDYRTFELFTNFKEAWPIFRDMFFSFSGLAFLGGLIFGSVAVIWYLKKYNINIMQMTDVAALALPLAYAIGRIGCQVSGDGCWGIPNPSPKPHWLSFLPDWLWAYDYPHNVLHVKLVQPVYPTPLYEMSLMFLVFLVLWAIRKRVKYPGILFSLYLILAGIERFFIEFIRHNTKFHILGTYLTQAQIISIIMIITGIIGLIFIYKHKEKIIQWSTPKLKPINKNPNNDQSSSSNS